MAASQAGGPLYGPRIGLEGLLLPSDPAARAGAEVVRLEARLAEFAAATAGGDPGGAAAALDAYQAIAEEALAWAGAHAELLETLRVALSGMTGGMAIALNVTVTGIAGALALKLEYYLLDSAISTLFTMITEVTEVEVIPALERA
jgi:hypothetical protein